MSDVAQRVIARVGLWWPDADEGRLGEAAGAWDRLAAVLDRVGADGVASVGQVSAGNGGDAVEAFAAMWAKYGGGCAAYLPVTAEACRAMGVALCSFADVVGRAKRRLEELAVIIGATLVAGAALAFFTFGISEAAAAAAATSAVLVAAGAAVGVEVSAAVAAIVAGVLVGAAFGAVEGVVLDIAVAQPVRVFGFHDGGFSFDEAKDWVIFGGVTGGILGGGRAGLLNWRAGHTVVARPPLQSLEDVFKDPSLLRGRPPGDLDALLQDHPEWRLVGGSGGEHRWVEVSKYRELWPVLTSRDFTGRELRYIPGGGVYGSEPTWYWHESTQKIVWEGHMNPYSGYVRETPDPPR